MTFKIKADVNAAKNIVVQKKNTGVSVTTRDGTVYNTNSAGEVTVPVADSDYTSDIIRDFPLSQYGDPYNPALNITSAGFILQFNKIVPLFIGGTYIMVPAQLLDLNAKGTAQSKTINIYVQLELGVPSYHFNTAEEAETNVNMFIGKVTTNATSITAININPISRFGVYRASTTNVGGAFPVSTGHPTQTGTINW